MAFGPKTNNLQRVDYRSSFLAATKLGPICSLRRVVLDLLFSFLRNHNHRYSEQFSDSLISIINLSILVSFMIEVLMTPYYCDTQVTSVN